MPEPTDPRAEYVRRLEARRNLETKLSRGEMLFGNARLALFGCAAIILYFVFVAQNLSPFWLAAPAAAFLFIVGRHERLQYAEKRARLASEYYAKGLARLNGDWAGNGETGARYLLEEHPYAIDLDLFGKGSLFERLSTARTQSGEKTLAAWLCGPANRDEIIARQEAVAELRGRLDLRERMALLATGVPSGVDLADLGRWGTAPPILGVRWRRWRRWLAPFLVILTVMSIANWAAGELPPSFCLAAIMLQAGFARWLKFRVLRVVEPVDRKAGTLALFEGILTTIENETFAAPKLVGMRQALESAGQFPGQRIGRLKSLVHWLDSTHNQYFALVSPLFLYTTQLAFAFEDWRLLSGAEIPRWFEIVGEFEALCSLAGYSYENPDDLFPEILPDGAVIEGEDLGHPLLPLDHCIRNDLRLVGDVRVLVISGSNMSGKSTFLRTVGVNTVLALAGGPVRAKRLRLSPLAVGATLRVQDSLQAGRSRFYAEIVRMRQLVDLAKGPLPLLFLLDEIFHGTNSHDRRLGAQAVVRSLVDFGAIGFVTTHDLALTHIVEQLAPRAINVHFEDHFENGTIHFDYRMRLGIVEKSNAIALMRSVGLEVPESNDGSPSQSDS